MICVQYYGSSHLRKVYENYFRESETFKYFIGTLTAASYVIRQASKTVLYTKQNKSGIDPDTLNMVLLNPDPFTNFNLLIHLYLGSMFNDGPTL